MMVVHLSDGSLRSVGCRHLCATLPALARNVLFQAVGASSFASFSTLPIQGQVGIGLSSPNQLSCMPSYKDKKLVSHAKRPRQAQESSKIRL